MHLTNRSTLIVLAVQVALIFSAAGLSSFDGQVASVLIRGGTLIDGAGAAPLKDVRILVEDGLVKRIWTAETADDRAPAAAIPTIDAEGKFILPGLIDSHVHYREYMGDLFLSHGVTTVLDLGNPYHWQKAVQNGLNNGRFHGPRFYFCGGPALSQSEEAELPSISRRNEPFGFMLKPGDAKQIVQAARQQADCLKLSEQFAEELFAPLAAEAKASGLAVISHSLEAMESADWGITGIEHMVGVAIATIRAPAGRQAVAEMRIVAGHKNSALYRWMEEEHFDEVIQHLVRRNVYINPTLGFEWKALSDRSATHEAEDMRLFNRPDLQYVPLDERLLSLGQYHWPDGLPKAQKEQFVEGYRKVQEFLRRFTAAGGKIYAGTDSAAATTPGLSLHHEMELLVDAGLSPMQALQAATKYGAELLGPESKLGTIEPGKLADLIVLTDDPLKDIRNSKSIEMVLKAGAVQKLGYDASHVLPIPHPGPISKHLYNPAPHIRDVQPPVAKRREAVSLRITGRGFLPSTVVTLDRYVLATQLISPNELVATLPPNVTAQSGSLTITVRNPKPGGGYSNAVPFIISER